MPKKTKKTAEAEAANPEQAAESHDTVQTAAPEPPPEAEPEATPAVKPAKRKTAPKKAAAKKKSAKTAVKKVGKRAPESPTEAEIDLEAAHRMQGESPATPEGGAAEAAAQAADTFDDAGENNGPGEVQALAIETDADNDADSEDDDDSEDEDSDDGFVPAPRPPAKLERLQKILAQAGVASRRHAESLITEGRVQVNGKIVTELGTKADSNRDHIRVDGKLLQGAERLRYFVLNKPRGFVTTVRDPEGRPTVMQFFSKMGERLYPVGRLDYLSEGLLLVTNDGELANKLTRAASGVEKTYLVKVSGQPTEEQLESLREGVTIDRGKPGEGRVRTSAARVRQVRVGENPWYEVVLIEGRNRELRKMFEEIGHFVEKIRRVGYGPLILDQEPGNLRELDPEELKRIRLAADGKWKPKRIKSTAMLPKHAGRTVDPEATSTRPGKPFLPVRGRGPDRGFDRGSDRGPSQGLDSGQARGAYRPRPEGRTAAPGRGPVPSTGGTSAERPRFQSRGTAPRPDDRGQRRNAGSTFGRPQAGGERRPYSKPPADRAEGRSFSKPPVNRTEGRGFSKPPAVGERRSFTRPPAAGARPFRERPATGGTDKPRFERPSFPSRPRRAEGAGFEDRKPFKPRADRPAGSSGTEPRFTPQPGRPGRPTGAGFGGDRRPPQGSGRTFTPRPEGRTGEKPSYPPRREGGPASRATGRPPAGARAAFTSSGVPRPGGARPSSKGAGLQGRMPGSGSARTGGGRPSSSPRPGNSGSPRFGGFKGKPGGRGGRPGGASGGKRT